MKKICKKSHLDLASQSTNNKPVRRSRDCHSVSARTLFSAATSTRMRLTRAAAENRIRPQQLSFSFLVQHSWLSRLGANIMGETMLGNYDMWSSGPMTGMQLLKNINFDPGMPPPAANSAPKTSKKRQSKKTAKRVAQQGPEPRFNCATIMAQLGQEPRYNCATTVAQPGHQPGYNGATREERPVFETRLPAFQRLTGTHPLPVTVEDQSGCILKKIEDGMRSCDLNKAKNDLQNRIIALVSRKSSQLFNSKLPSQNQLNFETRIACLIVIF